MPMFNPLAKCLHFSLLFNCFHYPFRRGFYSLFHFKDALKKKVKKTIKPTFVSQKKYCLKIV